MGIEELCLALKVCWRMSVSVDVAVTRFYDNFRWVKSTQAPFVPRCCRRSNPLPVFASLSGSPCCSGGRRRQGLPQRKNTAARPNVLAVGCSFVGVDCVTM